MVTNKEQPPWRQEMVPHKIFVNNEGNGQILYKPGFFSDGIVDLLKYWDEKETPITWFQLQSGFFAHSNKLDTFWQLIVL